MTEDHLPEQNVKEGRWYKRLAVGLGVVTGLPLLVLIANS